MYRKIILHSIFILILGFCFLSIHPQMANAGNPVYPGNIFNDYLTWKSNTVRKSGDYLVDAIYWLRRGGTYPSVTDINGDGLADILYATYTEGGALYVDDVALYGYLVFLNTGSNNFTLAYKCAITGNYVYHGDCAE